MRGDLDDVFLRGRLLDSMTQRELAAVPGLTQVAEMPDGSRQVSDERSGWSGVIPASPDQMRVVINPQQGSQQPPISREGVGTGAPLLAPSGPTMDAAAPVPAAVPAEDVEAAAAAPTTPTRHAVPGRPDPLHDPESLWWAGEATRGVLHGVNNTAEAFLEATRLGQFADWLEEQIPLGRVEYKLPETAVGEIAAGGAQVVAGMVPAMRLVRGIARLKGVLGASANFIRWSRWTAGGAIADALGWDEDEPTVFNLLKEMEPYDNETVEEIRQAVQGALAKNESDTELVKRLKMAGEGAVLGSTIDLVVGLVRGTRAVIRSMRSGDGAEQSVVRAIDDATRQLEELQAQGVAPGAWPSTPESWRLWSEGTPPPSALPSSMLPDVPPQSLDLGAGGELLPGTAEGVEEVVTIETRRVGDAMVFTSRLTPAERKFFGEFAADEADLHDFRALVPSFELSGAGFKMDAGDMDGLEEFVDDMILLTEKGEPLPPGIRNGKFLDRVLRDRDDVIDPVPPPSGHPTPGGEQ